MSQPFIGEIKMFGGNFPPRGYALCNGQLLAISQNAALFAILGTTYGGNGTTNFALPNMQSRAPVHWGTGPGLSAYVIGEETGTENVTLLTTNMPSHNHGLTEAHAKADILVRTDAPNATVPNGAFLGGANIYVTGQTAGNAALNVASMKFGNGAVTELTGSNIPISIIQPVLAVTFIIALVGIFPSRN